MRVVGRGPKKQASELRDEPLSCGLPRCPGSYFPCVSSVPSAPSPTWTTVRRPPSRPATEPNPGRLFPRPLRAGRKIAWSRPMRYSAPSGFFQRPLGPFMRSCSRVRSEIRYLQALPVDVEQHHLDAGDRLLKLQFPFRAEVVRAKKDRPVVAVAAALADREPAMIIRQRRRARRRSRCAITVRWSLPRGESPRSRRLRTRLLGAP